MFRVTHTFEEPQIPEPYRSIIRMVQEDDREFFEKNPDLLERIRPMVPGEFYFDQYPAGTMVQVIKWTPNFRTREPLAND